MTLNEYQQLAMRTAGPQILENPFYSTIGLNEEAGEYAGMIKHEHFHGWPENREGKLKELGDVLWYLTACASQQGFTLQEVADRNIAKLKERYPEGFSIEQSINRKEHQP